MADKGGLVTDAMIDDLLLSDDALYRVQGRMLATGLAETIKKFIETEHERGTHTGDIQISLISFFADVIASIIVQFAKDGAEERTAKLSAEWFDLRLKESLAQIPRHARRTHA